MFQIDCDRIIKQDNFQIDKYIFARKKELQIATRLWEIFEKNIRTWKTIHHHDWHCLIYFLNLFYLFLIHLCNSQI